MPLFYQADIDQHTRLGVWKIEEEEAFFLQYVPNPQQVTHPHKRLQHVAGRYLLQHLFPLFPYHEILVAGTRKPFLPQEQYHFSISHSGNFAAAIVSQQHRVGIDIELYSVKTTLVKNKYLTEAEMQLITDGIAASNEQLYTLLWCCKEAVYKYWGAGGIDFKKHISIQKIHPEKQQIDVLFSKQYAELLVQYSLLDTLSLAWIAA